MLKTITNGCEPTKGSKYSAAVDLYAAEDIVIGAGETKKVPLGVCIDHNKMYDDFIPKGSMDSYCVGWRGDQFEYFIKSHYMQLEPRSSLRAKGLQAGTGIIDLDYKDEIMIILHNPILLDEKGKINYSKTFTVFKGDKIAQIMLCKHKTYLLGVETEDERTGGFGSTDREKDETMNSFFQVFEKTDKKMARHIDKATVEELRAHCFQTKDSDFHGFAWHDINEAMERYRDKLKKKGIEFIAISVDK